MIVSPIAGFINSMESALVLASYCNDMGRHSPSSRECFSEWGLLFPRKDR